MDRSRCLCKYLARICWWSLYISVFEYTMQFRNTTAYASAWVARFFLWNLQFLSSPRVGPTCWLTHLLRWMHQKGSSASTDCTVCAARLIAFRPVFLLLREEEGTVALRRCGETVVIPTLKRSSLNYMQDTQGVQEWRAYQGLVTRALRTLFVTALHVKCINLLCQ